MSPERLLIPAFSSTSRRRRRGNRALLKLVVSMCISPHDGFGAEFTTGFLAGHVTEIHALRQQ